MTTDRPESTTLILFDGTCLLCGGSVGFLYRRDRTRRFLFVPLQSPAGHRLAAHLGLDPDDPSTFAAIFGADARFMSDGMLACLQRLGGLWRTAIVLRVVPPPLRDGVYRLVARHRYRWFGPRRCALSEEPWRDRLLTDSRDLPARFA